MIPSFDELDITRLHKCIDKLERGVWRWERGEGQTTARMFLMFGEIELGDAGNEYLFITENNDHAKWLGGAFLQLTREVYPKLGEEVLTDHEPGSFAPTLIILPNKQSYRFISIQRCAEQDSGFRAKRFTKIYHDVSPNQRDRIWRSRPDYFGRLDDVMASGVEII